ncbi:MAG: tetratricopeptide repeat protein [Cyclobacteriaceae bacterium]
MSIQTITRLIIFVFLPGWLILTISLSCNFNKNKDPLIQAAKQNEHIGLSNAMYAGTEACVSCHETEYHDWKGSHHDKAMMLADAQSVLGDFDDVVFESSGVKSRFFKKNDRYYVNTEDESGKYRDFEIIYTYGVEPLQQYIVEFPKGRFQCLRTAWDTEENKWYDLYPDLHVVHGEWIHWTQGGLNWNTMCSDCHSTNVKKAFDEETKAFNTSYAIINVSCEACHGPGNEHITLMESEEYIQNPEAYAGAKHMHLTGALSSKEQVDQCARCHSHRTQFTEAFDHVGEYMDHYVPSVLREDLYHPDGQILEEVYVYGSFTQSRMYQTEGVECADCHNVHSTKLKVAGNALCLQCHSSSYDEISHHFHTTGTDAAECVNCHMTGKTYMGNDYRRDHSFRVPRPDQSVKYNTPNACNDCHSDQSAQWAADWVVTWYGSERAPHFSDVLAHARFNLTESIPALIELAKHDTVPVMARSTAIYYLGNAMQREAVEAIKSFLNDDEPLVRYNAVSALSGLPQAERVEALSKNLTDSIRSVRIAAAGAMLDLQPNQLGSSYRKHFRAAMEEYQTGLKMRADFPGGQMEKAQFYLARGQVKEAEKSYLKAIDLDYYFNAARINLANLYYEQQRYDEAEQLFAKVIELEPEFGHTYYSMGLLMAEQNKMQEAVKYLEMAAQYMNDNPRVIYNYGLALQRVNRIKDAEQAFKTALKVDPDSESNLYALAVLYLQHREFKKAQILTNRLIKLAPENSQYQQLAAEISKNEKGLS